MHYRKANCVLSNRDKVFTELTEPYLKSAGNWNTKIFSSKEEKRRCFDLQKQDIEKFVMREKYQFRELYFQVNRSIALEM